MSVDVIAVICPAESHAPRISRIMTFKRTDPDDPVAYDEGDALWEPTGFSSFRNTQQGDKARYGHVEIDPGNAVVDALPDQGAGDDIRLLGDILDMPVEKVHVSRKLRCPLCRRDLTVQAETLDGYLEKLRHAGLDSVELSTLVRWRTVLTSGAD